MDEIRVVITGIGLVTPLGVTTNATWQALCNGVSGITSQNRYDMGNYPCRVAGFVKESPDTFDVVISKKNQQRTDRFMHLALLAGDEALRDAGLSTTFPVDRSRIGCYLGVGIGGLTTITESVTSFIEGGASKVSPFSIPKSINNLGPGWLSMHGDLQGPMMALTNACASGADAIGTAFRQIKGGYVDYMVAGGAESCITPMAIAAFGNMRTLSTWQGDPAAASRPFDRDRAGFVIAEGAGVIVLEREDFARKRGATIYAELVGYGAAADAHHVVAIHPEGRGALLALDYALREAKLSPNSVDYLNAHGTGTSMNDSIETKIIKKFFATHADATLPHHLLVSSTKSMTGHMLGAAGGVEAAIAALTIQQSIIPPTINLDNFDPACDLDYVPRHAREQRVEVAISQSFGFGGGNVVLALKRYNP